MGYGVGIDIGTTFSAAAVFRDGHVQAVTLGQYADSMPTAVFLSENGDFLLGDAAVRRLADTPSGGAREFKRRMGDTTPLVVSGAPYSADRLVSVVIRHVLKQVEELEGEWPEHVVVTHPANWQEFKIDLVRQAAEAAAGPATVSLVAEPVAAAIHYARSERIDVGERVAVYDLGGGTFDAAVLERTPDGFRAAGEPAGIERLGGMDLDAALLAHVQRVLGDRLDGLDREDRAVRIGLEHLRQECVEAKQALSMDTAATINVTLPGLHDSLRITRSEFEHLIRPVLLETMDSLRSAIERSGSPADELARILLIGGSSRIPLVSEIVSNEIGRPVAVDAHPKLAVAMGAAGASHGQLEAGAALPLLGGAAPDDQSRDENVPVDWGAGDMLTEYGSGVDRNQMRRVLAIAAAVAVVLVAGWFALARTEPAEKAALEPTAEPTAEPTVELQSVSIQNGLYRVDYVTTDFTPAFGEDRDLLHIHVFFDTTEPADAGRGGSPASKWTLTKQPTSFVTQFSPADRGAAQRMCAVVATNDHRVFNPASGNCVDLPDIGGRPGPTLTPQPSVTPSSEPSVSGSDTGSPLVETDSGTDSTSPAGTPSGTTSP